MKTALPRKDSLAEMLTKKYDLTETLTFPLRKLKLLALCSS